LLIGFGSQIGCGLVGRFPDPSDLALRALVRATVRKPKFEANQIQRTKPIGKPTRKEFGSPTITDAALVRRRLLSSAALLTGLGAVLFPLVEAAAAESQASETHLAEVPLASGATLTVERSGQVALFGINRPQIQNRLDPTPEVTRRNTRIHFIQPLKERVVREVGYGLSLEGASSADLAKSKQSKSGVVT
jgi:hypothetical protein